MELEDLTGRVIGCAIAVHRTLGPGFLEALYEKAIKALEEVHFAQVRSYLKAGHLKHGLLLNFSTMPLTIKRVLHDDPA